MDASSYAQRLVAEPRNNRSLYALQTASKAQKPLKATVAAFEALVWNGRVSKDFSTQIIATSHDLTFKWWFSKTNPLISGKSRLVKYYIFHLAKFLWSRSGLEMASGPVGLCQETLCPVTAKFLQLRCSSLEGQDRGRSASKTVEVQLLLLASFRQVIELKRPWRS